MPTIFGRILAGEIPARKVYEDDFCLAFYDVAPAAPLHILVIPKREVASLAHIEADDEALLGRLLYRASALGKQYCPGGFRVVINNGADAGQSVDHLHLHVLGGRAMAWPPG